MSWPVHRERFCWFICLVCLNAIHVTFAFYQKEIILNDDHVVKEWKIASQYFDSIAWYERDFIQHVLEKFLLSYEKEKNKNGSIAILDLTSSASNAEEGKSKFEGMTKRNNFSNECLKSLRVIDSALKSRKFWTYQSMYHPFDP